MDNLNDEQCDLKLKKIVFEKISFERMGFKNEEKLDIKIRVQVAENKNNIFKVTLSVNGEKKDEYNFIVQITGFFSVNGSDNKANENLINQNAVAILMPYVRSEVSLITAQPETECVVLPPFNIVKMMEE
jgi:preprotein translocase subunit SecB